MYKVIENIFLACIISGIFLNFFISITILSRLNNMKDLKKALLFLLLIITLTFYIGTPLLELYDGGEKFVFIIPAPFFIGPFYFLSMKAVIRGETRLHVTETSHFLISLILSLSFVIFFTALSNEPANRAEMKCLGLLAHLHILVYFAATNLYLIKQIPNKISGVDIDKRIKMRILLNIFFLASFALTGIGLMYAPLLHKGGSAMIAVLTLMNYIVSERYRLKIDYYKNRKNREYFHKLLIGTAPEELKSKIMEKLAVENLYREEITLTGLSKELGLKSYMLSHFINNFLNVSFNDLINGFRIDEAKNLISSKPGTTILEIALNVGFNSKASFNRAFKKFTGMTPTEFRNSSKP